MYALMGASNLSDRLREMTGREVIDMNRVMGLAQFLYRQQQLAKRGADYAVDSSRDWQAVLPSDNIWDSPEETARFTIRGLKPGVVFQLFDGPNFIGRADQKPVDVDIEDQEPPERIWSSRQHALIRFEGGILVIEDLNSSNGTFINRTRLYPGQKRVLNANDIIQIGTVQMKVIIHS